MKRSWKPEAETGEDKISPDSLKSVERPQEGGVPLSQPVDFDEVAAKLKPFADSQQGSRTPSDTQSVGNLPDKLKDLVRVDSNIDSKTSPGLDISPTMSDTGQPKGPSMDTTKAPTEKPLGKEREGKVKTGLESTEIIANAGQQEGPSMDSNKIPGLKTSGLRRVGKVLEGMDHTTMVPRSEQQVGFGTNPIEASVEKTGLRRVKKVFKGMDHATTAALGTTRGKSLDLSGLAALAQAPSESKGEGKKATMGSTKTSPSEQKAQKGTKNKKNKRQRKSP